MLGTSFIARELRDNTIYLDIEESPGRKRFWKILTIILIIALIVTICGTVFVYIDDHSHKERMNWLNSLVVVLILALTPACHWYDDYNR